MLLRSAVIKARLLALEEYVGMPRPRGGVTISARLDAQHALLVALSTTRSDMNRRLTAVEDRLTEVEERLSSVDGRLTRVEGRLTGVEMRLTEIENSMGKVLWGMTEIKNMLREQNSPPDQSQPAGPHR